MTLADKLASIFACGYSEDKGRIEYEGSVYQASLHVFIAVDLPASADENITMPLRKAKLRTTPVKAASTTVSGAYVGTAYRQIGSVLVNEVYYRLFPADAEWFSEGDKISMIAARSSEGALIGVISPIFVKCDCFDVPIPTDEELYPAPAKIQGAELERLRRELAETIDRRDDIDGDIEDLRCEIEKIVKGLATA